MRIFSAPNAIKNLLGRQASKKHGSKNTDSGLMLTLGIAKSVEPKFVILRISGRNTIRQ